LGEVKERRERKRYKSEGKKNSGNFVKKIDFTYIRVK